MKLVRRVIVIESRSAVPTDVVIVSHRRDDERQRVFARFTEWVGCVPTIRDTYTRDILTRLQRHLGVQKW